MSAESFQSCLTLCALGEGNPPSCSVHEDSPGKNTGVRCCRPPGDLPDPGIEPESLISPALAGGFFTTSVTWEAHLSLDVLFVVITRDITLCIHSLQNHDVLPFTSLSEV